MRTCNINQNYVEKYYTWSGILAASLFVIRSKTNRLKGYSPGQLIFGCDMIILIKDTVDWELLRQRKPSTNLKISYLR